MDVFNVISNSAKNDSDYPGQQKNVNYSCRLE